MEWFADEVDEARGLRRSEGRCWGRLDPEGSEARGSREAEEEEELPPDSGGG